jgi:anaerobic dimethyl sulfoxide reductase subunit A
MTFGTIQDGNEDDAFAHSKLIIMWGWNPAYTFHGGNTFYYMRMAKQRGCKFVVIDPQYTDSAASYDAWWIPIGRTPMRPCWPAWRTHLPEQSSGPGFHRQVRSGHGCRHDAGMGKGSGKLQGLHHGRPGQDAEDPEWAEKICGVSAADIKKLADMYARTKPAALKASWGRGATPTASSTTAWRPRAGDDRQHRHSRRLRRRRRQGLARGIYRLSLRRKRQPLVGFDQVRPLGALRIELSERQT